MLGSNPLYGCTTVCLAIYLLMDIWIVFCFWLTQIKPLWTFVDKSLYRCMLSLLLGKHLAVECLGHIVAFKKLPNCNPKWLYHSTYSPTVSENSSCSRSWLTLDIVRIFYFSRFGGGIMVSHCGFNYTLSRRSCTTAKVFMYLWGVESRACLQLYWHKLK